MADVTNATTEPTTNNEPQNEEHTPSVEELMAQLANERAEKRSIRTLLIKPAQKQLSTRKNFAQSRQQKNRKRKQRRKLKSCRLKSSRT